MKRILWILFTFFVPFFSEASQVSGYMSVTYISGTTYQITVVDYTIGDPSNSGLCGVYADLDSVRINWGDGGPPEWAYRTNGNTYPPNTYPGGDSICDCRKMSTYVATHTFPGPGMYEMSVNGGSRIANIINIANSGGQNLVLFNTMIINPVAGYGISSPIISDAPVCTYATVGDCYYFNLGTHSLGGDSVSFVLGNCNFANGYFTPPNVTINSLTDTLAWCSPTTQGIYNFSILIITYHRVIIGVQPHQIPVDTMDEELEVVVSPNPAGIDKPIKNPDVPKLFPNPNNGKFTIELQATINKEQVEVYNMFGEKVYVGTLNSANTEIDLSSQSAGIYLYRIVTETGQSVSSGKVMIQ